MKWGASWDTIRSSSGCNWQSQIWNIGSSSGLLHYGVQPLAVVFPETFWVKSSWEWSWEFFFFNVTSVSWKEEFFTRWEASKTWGTRRSIKRTSNMTFHRTREFALSLEWSHQQISASCTAHTMVLAMFLFMFPDMVLHPQAWAIPAHMQNLTMKGAESMRETWSLLSEMSEHRPSF